MKAAEELSTRIAGEVVLSPDHGMTIRKWREIFGLSQTDLAALLGVSASVVSDYESGRRSSPGADVIKRTVKTFIEFDLARGGKVVKTYARLLTGVPAGEAILDMREFSIPVSVEDLCGITDGEIVANKGMTQKAIYGYTAIDSPKAIIELESEEFLKIYGLTSERALIFTKVSSGRSPFVAIRVSAMKPGVVVIQGPPEVDSLGLEIAKRDRIPVIHTRKGVDELITDLQNM